ncbi:DUF664 domain-containing protein [Streptomyces sp. NPDC057580]|uniref:mycothiol transferase n=1 Tax=Streptomyces sp. NPDC057580 TaxID=3346173 RepID=UPI0036C86F45
MVLHMIEESARHAGHLDIVRELLDGGTGLGPRQEDASGPPGDVGQPPSRLRRPRHR